MQMRFDGNLGFPGGLVDPGEDSVEALNRELTEEMNLDGSKHEITEACYIVSHWSISKRLCLHFYALEVTLSELFEIEKSALLAKDYGSEVCILFKLLHGHVDISYTIFTRVISPHYYYLLISHRCTY